MSNQGLSILLPRDQLKIGTRRYYEPGPDTSTLSGVLKFLNSNLGNRRSFYHDYMIQTPVSILKDLILSGYDGFESVNLKTIYHVLEKSKYDVCEFLLHQATLFEECDYEDSTLRGIFWRAHKRRNEIETRMVKLTLEKFFNLTSDEKILEWAIPRSPYGVIFISYLLTKNDVIALTTRGFYYGDLADIFGFTEDEKNKMLSEAKKHHFAQLTIRIKNKAV